MNKYKNLSDEFKRLRLSLLLSRFEMADALGMSVSGIRKIEIGETKSLQVSTIRAIEEKFGCKAIISDDNIIFKSQQMDAGNNIDISDKDRLLLKRFHAQDEHIQIAILLLLKIDSEE